MPPSTTAAPTRADFHPTTGKPPGGYDDGVATYPVEVRDDGIYVGFPVETPHRRTVSDVMAETLVAWGVRHVWGMVGHSNLGLADALRRLLLHRRPRSDQPPHGALGRQCGPLTGAGPHRPGPDPGAGSGRLP